MRPSRPTAIRSKKNSCGDRHARRREAERRSRESALVLVADRQRSDARIAWRPCCRAIEEVRPAAAER